MSFCCCFAGSLTPTKPLLPEPCAQDGVLPSSERAAVVVAKLFASPQRPPETSLDNRVHPSYGTSSSQTIETEQLAHEKKEENRGAAEVVAETLNGIAPVQERTSNLPRPIPPPGPKQASKADERRLEPPPSPAIKPQQSPVKVRKPPLYPSSRSLRGRVYEVTHWVIYPRSGESSRQYKTRSLKGTGLDLDD